MPSYYGFIRRTTGEPLSLSEADNIMRFLIDDKDLPHKYCGAFESFVMTLLCMQSNDWWAEYNVLRGDAWDEDWRVGWESIHANLIGYVWNRWGTFSTGNLSEERIVQLISKGG